VPGEHETTRQRYVAALQGFAQACGERLTWTSDGRAATRDELLRSMLAKAVDGSAWHRNRLAKADIGEITSEDLSSLPTMTKADLMGNWEEIVTDPTVTLREAQRVLDAHAAGEPFRFLHDRYLVVATGGSTGVRGVIVGDEHSFGAMFGSDFATGRAQAAAGLIPDLEAAGTVTQARLNATSPVHVSAAVPAILGGDVGRELHTIGPATPVSEGVDILNRVQPQILMGYPSLLEVYANEAQAGRLGISPARVGANAEPLRAEAKVLIEATWGVPVSNAYGASEGFLAKSWGGSTQLYQPDDVVVMELVDDENRPVGPGVECSRVLLTHLHNHIQPLIRYEISDRVSWAEAPDGCPWEGQWLNPPQGRSDDVFRYGAGGEVVVHPHVFRSALLADPAILSYQIHQTPAGADIRVIPADSATVDTAGLSSRVSEGLKQAGVADPVVDVSVVAGLEHHAQSGKLRRFVPLTRSASDPR
jgi:phenylacetate-CoA ligase